MNSLNWNDLFSALHPGFFEAPSIRTLPEGDVFEELALNLRAFDPAVYAKQLDDSVTFGSVRGGSPALLRAVEAVEPDWIPYFSESHPAYCAFVNGEIASFCLITDFGAHSVNGRIIKIGGPGCVGTVPAYRRLGIGLTLVKNATLILKDQGYDYSYIHYTGVGPWYQKLGYRVCLRWNRNGILS